MAHSFLSPSSFPRIAKCPASLLASMSAPPRSSAGDAANEGTRLHEVAERILSNSSLLWPPTIHDGDEMIRPYVEYCKALIDVCDRFGIESRVSVESRFRQIPDHRVFSWRDVVGEQHDFGTRHGEDDRVSCKTGPDRQPCEL